MLPTSSAHSHAGCGHSLVAGEARRWSQLHRQHRVLLEERAAAGIAEQEGPNGSAAAAEQQQQQDSGSSSSLPAAANRNGSRLLLAEAEASPGTVPIRVWVEYQGTESLDAGGKQRLYDTVNIALGVLQKFYRVRRPAPGKLLVKPFCRMWQSAYYCNLHQPDFLTGASDNSCGAASINASHIAPYEQCSGGGFNCQRFQGGPGEFTDYYLYITALQDEHCGAGAVAWALPCLYDTNTNRPLLGSANICPAALLKADPDAAVAVLVHELTHALGFTDDMFDKFVDASGQPVPKNQVVQRYVDPYGRETAMIITPSVQREVRSQFGCESLPGAALENEGGQGSANAHWEYRWFQGELMVATNLFAVYGKPATMSRVTLAFMADTGWYDVNFDAAGFLNWGWQAGCDFVEKTCADWIAANPGQQLFCTRDAYTDTVNTLCTFDGLARAKCEDAQFADGCVMKVALGTVPNCLSKQYAASAGDKFGWQNGLSSRCVPVTWLFNTHSYQFPDTTYKEGWRDAMCYKSSCDSAGALQLDILGQQVACPSGQMVDLAKVMPSAFQKGLVGPCPDNGVVCNSLSCNESCTVGGTCVKGTCHCNLMYTGPQCAKKLTPSGNYTNYVPVVDDGSGGGYAGFDTGYLMMSSRLASSQSQLYLSLDKYKAAVAQLAGVATTRVAVLSFLADTPATSLVGGRRLAAATPLPASSAPDSTPQRRRALQQQHSSSSSSSSASEWPWQLLPDVAAAADSSSSSTTSSGRLLLQSGALEVYSRIATTSQQDSDAIIGRINNATRQADFEKTLAEAGLKLVPGSVAVRRAGSGYPGGGGGGWGLPGLNLGDPNTRRILIIVASAVGAALLVMLLGWWASCCMRRSARARRQQQQRQQAAALQQQFIVGGGSRTGGTNTPGSSNSSGSQALRPLFGAGNGGRPASAAGGGAGRLFNPFAAGSGAPQQQAALGAAYLAAPPPAAGVPIGGYTVAGRAFATAKEADDYALALALSQSLQEQQRSQLGGFLGRVLPSTRAPSHGGGVQQQPQYQQQQPQQPTGYPPVGFGHGRCTR